MSDSGFKVDFANLQALPIGGGNGTGETVPTGSTAQVRLFKPLAAETTIPTKSKRVVSFWSTVDMYVRQEAYDGSAAIGTNYFLLPKNTIYQTTAKTGYDYLTISAATAGTIYIAFHETD